MLVPAAAWGLDLQRVAFVAATAADLVTIAATAVLIAEAGYPRAALIAAATLAVSPAFLEYSVSGMETSLYVALIMAALWASTHRREWVTGLMVGLVALCRPEGGLLGAAVCGTLLRRSPRSAGRVALVAAAVVLPWVVFASVYFGNPLPASIRAKWAAATDPLASLRVIRAVYLHGWSLVLSVLAALGVARLWMTAGDTVKAWIVWASVYTAIFTAARAFNLYLWYFSPLLPLYFAGVAVALDAAWTRAGAVATRTWSPRAALTAAGACAMAIAVLIAGFRLSVFRADLERRVFGRERLYEAIATRLAQVNPACPIAAIEIGALGYSYPGPILDLAGLVSPSAVGRAEATLRSSPACWLVSYDDQLRALLPELVYRSWFRREFSLVEEHAVGPTQKLLVYRRTGSS